MGVGVGGGVVDQGRCIASMHPTVRRRRHAAAARVRRVPARGAVPLHRSLRKRAGHRRRTHPQLAALVQDAEHDASLQLHGLEAAGPPAAAANSRRVRPAHALVCCSPTSPCMRARDLRPVRRDLPTHDPAEPPDGPGPTSNAPQQPPCQSLRHPCCCSCAPRACLHSMSRCDRLCTPMDGQASE